MGKFLYLVLLSALALGVYGGQDNDEKAVSDTEKPTPIPSFRCPTFNGLFPNTDNCQTYFLCFYGIQHLMVCPNGLHYSYKSRGCEQPCVAYCEKSLACECKWPTCGLNDLCSLLPEVGPCKAGFYNYYFNRSTGQCEKFLYGGCQGNENNFQRKEDCERACHKTDEDSCPTGEVWSDCQAGCQMKCEDEFVEKPCQKMCVPGCICEEPGAVRGPDNKCIPPPLCPSPEGEQYSGRYPEHPVDESAEQPVDENTGQPTEENTERRVDKNTEQPEPLADEIFECSTDGLYPHPTNCTSFFKCEKEVPSLYSCPRNRHFNSKTKKCESPCRAHCDRTYACKCKWPTCGTNLLCSKPPRPGPCKGKFKRYYFDKFSGNCETFNYGGCLGNENNFHTITACERKCKHSLDICKLPAKTGVCKGNFTRYYFNYKKEKCETFTYGGCKGNHNNFKTIAECESTCLKKQEVVGTEPLCTEDGVHPDFDNCARYMLCSNGQSQIVNCPPGLHFNEATKECDSPCDARCDMSLAMECGWPMGGDFQCPIPDGKFNYPDNDRKYIECVKGVAIVKDCLGYRQFDFKIGKCVYH